MLHNFVMTSIRYIVLYMELLIFVMFSLRNGALLHTIIFVYEVLYCVQEAASSYKSMLRNCF